MFSFRFTVFLTVIFFLFSTRAAAEVLDVKVDEAGFIRISGRGGMYLDGFGLYPEGLNKANTKKDISTDTGGNKVTTVKYVLDKGGAAFADFVTVVEEGPEQVKIRYELKAREDFSGGMNLAGDIPAKSCTGKGMWFTVDEENPLTRKEKMDFKLFPARYRETGDNSITDATPPYFGWLTNDGYGLKIKARTPVSPRKYLPFKITDLRGMSQYVFRMELLTVFNMNNFMIHPYEFRKGEVVRWDITVETFNNEDFIPIALRHGEAMIDIQPGFEQLSSGENELKLDILNLMAKERKVKLEYKVTDDIGAEIASGGLDIILSPLERISRGITVPSYKRQNYRVFLKVTDAENKVASEIKRVYKFDVPDGQRPKYSMSDRWQVLPVEEKGALNYPPPEAGWQWHHVPVINNPFVASWFPAGKKMWFRRKFDLPEGLESKRVKIRFEDVRDAAELWLNGKNAGTNDLGSAVPYVFDITEFLKPGENEICMGVVSSGEAKIFGGVYLMGYPDVYTDDLFVQTSYRNKVIVLKIQLKNEGKYARDVELISTVYDKGGKALELPPRKVTVNAGSEMQIEIKQPWQEPHLWMPDDPYLYNLVTMLKENGGEIDEAVNRFGFREVWRNGPDVVLNGVPFGMFGISGVQHPLYMGPGRIYRPRESIEEVNLQIQEAIRTLQDNGVRIGRLWVAEGYEWLEECDEAGFLIEEEPSAWAYWGKETNKVEDPEYFKKWGRYIGEVIKRDRNNPSVIMWSMGNECLLFFHGVKDFIARHAALADEARKYDSTRLITFEGGMDPLGKADVINIHYPHEFWTDNTLYPDEAYWLDKPIDLEAGFPPDNQNWLWKKDKPFYTGEAGATFFDPSPQSFFLGDEGYELSLYDGYAAFIAGRYPFYRFQNEAWRYYGVNWTDSAFFDEVRYNKDLYEPFYVYCRQYNKNFYGSQKVMRTLRIINDFIEQKPGNWTLEWQVSTDGKRFDSGKTDFILPPHRMKTVEIEFTAPEVRERTDLLFEISLYKDKNLLATRDYDCSVFPSGTEIKLTKEIMLYDKTGRTKEILDKLNIKHRKSDTGKLDPARHILLIGEDSLDESFEEKALKISEFVQGGGRVICFQQEEQYPAWMPVPVKLSKEHSSTICYIQDISHPVIKGLKPEDVKYWGGKDHVVARNEFEKPTAGNYRVIINSGSARRGLYWTSLLEIPYGSGYYLLSQMNLTEKIEAEPLAREIFINMLGYVDTAGPRETVKTALLTDREGALRETLDKLGCKYRSVTGKLSRRNLEEYGILIAGGSEEVWHELAENKEKVVEFVESGGKVWLYNLTPASLGMTGDILGVDINLSYYPATQLIKTGVEDEIIKGISNYDLYWPLGGPVADGVVGRKQIMDYACLAEEDSGVKVLTHPAALLKIVRGRGFFMIDQTHWDTGTFTAPQPLKLASILLTNLGAEIDVSQLGMVKEKKKKIVLGGTWLFNGGIGSGNVVKDSTPNGNDAKIHGAVWKWDGGRVWVLEFDGEDDYAEIADPLNRDLSPTALDITEEITVEAWAKPYANTNHGPIAVKGSSVGFGPTYTYRIATRNDDTMTGGICTPSTEYSFDVPVPRLNEWHHYVLTGKSDGPVQLYIDGKMEYKSAYTIKGQMNAFPGYPIRVGISYDGKYKYKGLVGELKLYGRMLTEKEIMDSYKDGSVKYKGSGKE